MNSNNNNNNNGSPFTSIPSKSNMANLILPTYSPMSDNRSLHSNSDNLFTPFSDSILFR